MCQSSSGGFGALPTAKMNFSKLGSSSLKARYADKTHPGNFFAHGVATRV
jgi:hypothetical protein